MSTPNQRFRIRRGGFTLIELLMVIVIIGVLAGLLLPAIGGAVRRAREASVNAEINQMAQALADFKSKYGDYPPSRILLVENGNYGAYMTTTTAITSGATTDISVAQLAQRSLLALRKFWPRLALTTNGTAPLIPNGTGALTGYYDFNGSGGGGADPGFVLDGRQCLAFFLGGIPQFGASGGTFQGGMTGFSRNPQNPFLNSIIGDANSSTNRTAPLFEFNGGRMEMVPVQFTTATATLGFPAYFDPNSSVANPSYYAYFSSYGGAYDPNDVNVMPQEPADGNGNAMQFGFLLNFPLSGGGTTTTSPAPNPYTNSLTNTTGTPVSYINPQTFQIISPGGDNLYGYGGQYSPNADPSLPPPAATVDRTSENDNLTNFHNGRLQ